MRLNLATKHGRVVIISIDVYLVTNIPLGIKEVSFLGAPFTADGIMSVLDSEGHGEISVPIQMGKNIPANLKNYVLDNESLVEEAPEEENRGTIG
jgi:hypothetical protein